MGPPGSGKGTQATVIATALGVESVSSGDLFRTHQQNDTELGILARSYMEKGTYVPDAITIKMVVDWIKQPTRRGGFVLDGFPRTYKQAEALDLEMKSLGGVDRVLFINVSEKELESRLTGRMICKVCQTPYHVRFAPPKEDGHCDTCKGELYQRKDDKPDVVSARIKIYNQETAPVVDYYRRSGILNEVDGEQPVSDVAKALQNAING